MIKINNKFAHGQIVYLLTDPDQLPRIVLAVQIDCDNSVMYRLASDSVQSWHYEIEISEDKNVTMS